MAFKTIVFLVIFKYASSMAMPDPNVNVNVNVNVEDNDCNDCTRSCLFGKKYYKDGAIIEDACMILQCMKGGNWKYLGVIRKECAHCTAWGDPHINGFDNHTLYEGNFFMGVGNYTVTQNGLGEFSTYGVISEFVACAPVELEASCVSSATYYEPGLTVEMKLPGPFRYCKGTSDDDCMIKVFVNDKPMNIGKTVIQITAYDGTVLIFEHSHIHKGDLNCVNVVGTKGLSVSVCSHDGNYAFLYVFAFPTLQSVPSQLYGLCDTYTGTERDCYTYRNETCNNDLCDFGESWVTEGDPSCRSVLPRPSTPCDTNATLKNDITDKCTKLVEDNDYCPGGIIWWCAKLRDACVYDLCRISEANHNHYLLGYASHLQLHASVVELVGSGSCSCHYVPFKFGCVIRTPAPPHHACKCTAHWTSHCSGAVVNCISPSSKYCIHPNLNIQSCEQASGSNCDGY